MMAAGLLILVLGLDLLGLRPQKWRRPEPAPAIAGVPVPFAERPPAWRPALTGALNGLVPCSLVFSVAVKAAATAEPVRAGLLMSAFGIGTLPAMMTVSWIGANIGDKAKGQLARLAGLLVVALGLWTLYEGFVFYDIMRGLANW